MTRLSRLRPGRPGRVPARRGSSHRRIGIGFLAIAFVLSMFAARLVQLQGIDPGSYAALAAAEGTEDVVLPAARGDITDRNGDPLAASVAGTMIVADPALTSDDAADLAGFLARRLDVDYQETLQRLRAEDSRFQYIARQVPTYRAEDVVADAEEKGFSGLFTENDPLRTYPNGDLAANLVGFLGTPEDDGSAVALAGLEDSFNSYLSGTDGEARYQMGAGNQIPLGDNTVTPAQDGSDLQTTIDQDLQWYTQQVLQQTVESAGGESGIAVVMDSRTGQLLSLADYPTYDAADPQESPEDLYKSSALTDVYEPGSVEKALTMAGLLDAGLATPRTRLTVPGELNRQDRPIGDYWDHGTLRLTLAGVLAKSSNIGTVLASDEFGRGQLRRYLSSFGLGKRTDVGLGGETKGILKSVAVTTDQEEDRISFGQSLSVNAVQMTAAINAIANGGVRIDPSLVLGSARADDGTEVGTDQVTEHRVVSEQAAHQTMLMMERVIDPDAGVAPAAAVPGYRVAGKTGTAQRVGEECGCYDGTTTVSFAGFAPADDPRFTVYVVVHAPSNGGGGGSVAGPAFAKLMSYALRRYGVAPTDTQPSRLPVEW
ncbi:peptidoglycan D,D-transpeptidase FtsI family protein [Nocardioides sambongensis]|uniref:peptidoglycan D,D-transpeptidase FtsI family protein n=1 Tax=Nocardioides sambongensis TaxID=2589074 RepID=UPI001E435032|nr:penicillin-binding protein 2 [Nocardioides sambongensis]